MSNKPRIYGYCPAGCKWETVHHDEFERSASVIACQNTGYGFVLNAGKTYRIKKANPSMIALAWGFLVKLICYAVNEDGVATEKHVYNLLADDEMDATDLAEERYYPPAKYSDFLTIKLWEVTSTYESEGRWSRVAHVTINGEYHAIEIGTSTEEETYSLVHMEVYDADECYLVNEFAQIEAQVKVAPEMPVPTENTEKKITESGYYAAYAVYSSITFPLGVFYYPENSLGFNIRNGNNYLRIYTDGSVKVGTISQSVNDSGNVVSTETELPWYTLYTAKLDS